MTAREFSNDIDAQWSAEIEKFNALIGVVALDILRGLVLKTPVDTGRARGNWSVAVAAPDVAEYPQDPAGSATIARGSAVISGYDISTFKPLWFSNNLPYIERLEGGYSTQAPQGMAALTIAEISAKYADVQL